jgi:hypothetical protein
LSAAICAAHRAAAIPLLIAIAFLSRRPLRCVMLLVLWCLFYRYSRVFS